VERLAILPVENLSDDSALTSAAAAIGAMLLSQTTGLRNIFPYLVSSASDVETLRPTRVLRSYLTKHGNTIRLHAVLHDSTSGKALWTTQTEGPRVSALAGSLAERITPEPRPFSTRNPEAIRSYGEALNSGIGPQAEPALRHAVALDAAFGDAWILLAQALVANRQPHLAREVVKQALWQKLDSVTRAKLEVLATDFQQDPVGGLAALERLAEQEPTNADVNRGTALQLVQRRQLDKAIACYRRAARSDPGNGQIWNELAYALGYAGIFNEGVAAAQRYVALAPLQANPSDSLGDVLFMAGRFKESGASYLEGHKKDPRFFGGMELRKAAAASFMSGDKAGADELFRKYSEVAAKHPLLELQKAQWLFETDRASQALQSLEAFARSKDGRPEAASQAWSQLAIWHTMRGDLAAARAAAASAGSTAGSQADTPQSRLAVLAQFVSSEPATASEWTLRAERALADPRLSALKRFALGYALLRDRHWREAALIWKEALAETPPDNDGVARTFLAWALAEGGKPAEAKPLVFRYPHPRSTGEGVFDALAHSRFSSLRAALR
jgi:tetratricopeptide (TPR) repeat protein